MKEQTEGSIFLDYLNNLIKEYEDISRKLKDSANKNLEIAKQCDRMSDKITADLKGLKTQCINIKLSKL